MCGFVGQLGKAPQDLRAATRSLRHRGPDDEGFFSGKAGAGHLDLGFRRLAVIDLSPGGHQPFATGDGKLQLVYNGELYNHDALRLALQQRGHQFRSRSDTEVVLRAYEELGDAFLHELRGMFALALWDGRRDRLLLARDRLGIKPLFFTQGEGRLAFASEIKALLALGAGKQLDRAALADYLRFLYVRPPRTIFAGIEKLGGGERLIWEGGAARIERWWDLARIPERRAGPLVAEELRHHLREAVQQHLASDVPLGAFLSGGLDSSSLVALAGRPLQTFCMTFAEERYDERVHARRVAERFGCQHTEIAVAPDVAALLPQMVRGFDEPFGNPTALLAYELSRKVREHVTVALAGDGADELFLGYPRYAGARLGGLFQHATGRMFLKGLSRTLSPLWRDSSRGAHWPRRAREFLETAPLGTREAYESWVTYFSGDEVERLTGQRPSTLAQLFEDAPGGSDCDRLTYVDLHSFLPDNLLAYTDRMSMAHGLEVRVPFCDHKLVELLAALPFDQRMPALRPKALLAQAMEGVLPAETLSRKKLGFNPPMGVWLHGPLAPWVEELSAWRGPVDPEAVAAVVKEHRAGRRDLSLQVWALIVLRAFCDEYRPA